MILPITPARQVIVAPGVPEVPAIPPVTEESDSVDVITINDDTVNSVIALISIKNIERTLVLWEGQAYIDIGNWTQEQANARILELI